MRNAIILFLAFLMFSMPAQSADSDQNRPLSDDEIDAKVERMQEMLPIQIPNGIRWIAISRKNKEIKYTYIVNIDFAALNDNQRADTMARLKDFGCHQMLPVMCDGLKVVFASKLTARTAYHDSFGNFLFDCNFTPKICRSANI